MDQSKLFEPIRLCNFDLEHRVAMAPLTRLRADKHHVPAPMMQEYYTQRASVPGTLLIAEATLISPTHAGVPHAPGIWTEAQIEGWRKITNAIHAKGCRMICQLVAPGRAADVETLKQDGGGDMLCSSAMAMPGEGFAPKDGPTPTPREMGEEDIQACISDFVQAVERITQGEVEIIAISQTIAASTSFPGDADSWNADAGLQYQFRKGVADTVLVELSKVHIRNITCSGCRRRTQEAPSSSVAIAYTVEATTDVSSAYTQDTNDFAQQLTENILAAGDSIPAFDASAMSVGEPTIETSIDYAVAAETSSTATLIERLSDFAVLAEAISDLSGKNITFHGDSPCDPSECMSCMRLACSMR